MWLELLYLVLFLFASFLVNVDVAPSALMLLIGAVYWRHDGSILQEVYNYLLEHPWMSLGCICLYFSIGLLWFLWKWKAYVTKQKGAIIKRIQSYSEPVTDALLQKEFKEYIPYAMRHYYWATHWPLSMCHDLFTDFLKDVFNILFNGALQRAVIYILSSTITVNDFLPEPGRAPRPVRKRLFSED